MKRKILKWGLIVIIGGLLIGGGFAIYMFYQPHRDVQATTVDYKMNANQLVNEYLANAQASNKKYLDQVGESKIIEITGTVSEVSVDLNNSTVILLKADGDKAGVSCTLLETVNIASINLGDVITIKGVIRAGAGYDEDLGLYEDVIMEKGKIIKQ
jgi:putative nucleic acid binding protein